jgi:hypothetical protein
MEQSPSWEADNHSASQIPRILWNPKVHLLYSERAATSPYPKPDESNPHLPNLLP